ncbi:hypothetical protein HDU79_001958 [Rhizoclosmatium sp. JEL0117]|nr:hypothetical protein HDU79_001958 [Rhizoclosmatium sp. JEL0117]
MGISQAQEDIWAYRAYVPTLPCANKIIQVKWDQVVWTKHRNKLKSIVQSVDNKEPTRYSHLSAEERARKSRGKLDTETKIQLENKNLLYRITRHITKVPNPAPPPKTVTGKIRPKPPQPDAVVRKLGLNGPRNRTLRVQTDQANDMYLQRVENSEPFYDTKKFQKDRINTLKYLQSISRFPKRYVQELESSGVHIKRAIPEEVTRKVVTPLPSRQASVVGPLRSKSVSQRPSSALSSPSQRPSSAFSSPFQNANSDISPSSQSTTRPSSSKRISFDAHSTKSSLEYTGEQGPPIPPRYSPKAPLVPRVAKIRPKSAPSTRDEKLQPKERKPIVQLEPRAYRRWKDKLEARQEQIAKEEKLKVGGKNYSGVYMMDELVLHEYLDEFPGDEELFIPNCEGTGWGLTGLGCQISGGKGVSGSGGVAREKVGRSGLDEETVAKALVTGVAFGSSFVMKEPKKYLCRVHVSSVKGSFERERRKFVLEELVEIRNFCMCLGIEFQWNDLTLGLSRDMDDSNKFEKLQRWYLESSMKDSIAFNQIAFFDHNFYGERDIPTEIDAAVFDQLVIQAHSINSIPQEFNLASEALLEKWYELDENWVPPRRILRPINSVIPEYSDPTNDEAHKKWIDDNKIPLQALMKISAVKLGRNGILEPASVQRFVQSQFQSEVLYGIVAYFEQMNEGRTSMNSDSSGAPVNPITSAIEDGILHLAESRPEPNRLNEEILVHITQFKLRANDHKLREHLIEKVIAYIFRNDAVSLPPFVISGDSSMGKTAIIGKVLQTCIQRMAENLQERKPSPSPTMKRDESSGSLSSNATSVGTACTTNTVEMQTLVKKTKSILLSGGLSAKRGSIQPVFIARIVGITPDSSTSYGLMKSITHQICLAYNVSTNIDDEISLEMFREALKFATAEKPLVIALAKVDSLVSGPMNSRISWLIDVVPPFVRIIVSAHDEEVITFVTKRIRARAPSVVYAACKNGPPPSQAELDTAHDPYILKVGEIIAPVLKACLKKMNDAAKRKIRGEQAEALRKAFADCTPVNGIVPIRMMKLLHSMSKEWRSFTSVDGLLFPKTIREALEMQLLKLEAVHGKKLVSTVLGLIAMSRDGLTQNEILDLVSLDSELRDLSHKLLPLIYDTKKYFMRRTVWGGEVFSLSMDKELLSVINNRYLSDEDKKQVLADYLTEYFSVGLSTPSGALLQMPLRMPVIENLGFQWNERKIRELPNALIQSGRWHKIEELFSDFEFFAGLVCLNLAHKTCEELYEILLYSHDQEIPVGTQRLLEALLDFMVINRETLNQTHPGLHFVMLQEQLSSINPDPEDDDMLLSGNAAVSSDGKLVVFGIRGIRLLNTQTLTIIWTQRLHPIDPLFELHGISQIRFMNDAGSVVVVSDKGSKMNRLGESNVAGATYEYRTCIQQFEVGKGQQGLVSGYLAEDPIHSIAPIEDHSCLAIGGPTGIVDIINLKDGSIIASEHVSHSVTALNYLPDIQPSVFAETKKYRKRATNWDSSIKEYSLDNHHYRLVAGSIDGIMQVMGFRNQPEKIRRTSVSTAACSKDGEKLLIIGGVSKEYKLQNLIGPQNTDRRPSLSNYPVSTPSFENMNEMIARARSGIDDSNNDSAHLLDAPAKAQSRTLSSKSRSVSILKKHTDSSTSGTALKKQVTFSSLPKIHLPEDTEISIWDIPTGKRIISIPISADIIWCDFECSYKGPECFATGERNGIVKIWDWDIVEAASSSPSKQTGDIDYVEFNVCKDSSSSVVVGYSLNPVNHILAVAISIFMPQQVHTEEAPEKFVEPTSIELWNFTTGERFVHYQVGISSLPCVHGPMSNPLLSLSWGNLSDVFTDYFPSGSNRRTLPTCLVTGIEKLVVIANEPIPKCAGLKRFIEEKLGVNSVMRCTASCQSSEDARVMLLGVCDAVYWVKEGYDEEVEDVDSVGNDDEENELISRQPSVVVATGEEQQPEQDILPSTAGEYDANPDEDINVTEVGDFAVAVEPPPVEIPIPNFRIRKIPTPSGETVISAYHLKTIQVDAIIIATDFGTVAVYDISLPPRYLNENRNEVIRKHAPLISIWHARTSLLGMQVLGTYIPQTKEEFRLDPKNEWRVILWGRNGFTTVLDIRL